MVTKRLPKSKWTLPAKVYEMPAAVEGELMALGAKHNNSGDPQLSQEENFTDGNRTTLKVAFIDAVETYWTDDAVRKGPTEASVRNNIKEIGTLIEKLIKKLERLDLKTADGLVKHGAAEVPFDIEQDLSRMARIRLAHAGLWRTLRAANRYLSKEPMSGEDALNVLWNSATALKHGSIPLRVGALMVLWDGIARSLGEQQTLGISGDALTGSLVEFLELFMREAKIKLVQRRTVAEDFLLARKMWMEECRNERS